MANNFPAGFVNGTRGRVVAFEGNTPIVELPSGREVKVERHSWKLEDLMRAVQHCTGPICVSDDHEFRFVEQ